MGFQKKKITRTFLPRITFLRSAVQKEESIWLVKNLEGVSREVCHKESVGETWV